MASGDVDAVLPGLWRRRRRQPGGGVLQVQRNSGCGGLAERNLPVAVLSVQYKEGWARALGGSNVLIMMRRACHRRLRLAVLSQTLHRAHQTQQLHD